MSWPPTKEEWEKIKEKMTNPPPREAPTRMVSPKMYDVLKSMVEDGLISGAPYSEMATEEAWSEFCKRMGEK